MPLPVSLFRTEREIYFAMAPKSSKKKQIANNFPNIDELSEEGRHIVDFLSVQQEEMFSKFTSLLQEKDVRINQLESDLKSIKSYVKKFEEKCDDVESNDRKNDIIISGGDLPIVSENENSSNVARDVIKKKLNVIVRPTDVVNAYRLGKKPSTQQPDRRNLLVKLSKGDIKQDLYSACRTVKPKNLYINENLIQKRSHILYCLRRIKKEYPDKISGCNSNDMKVFVWVKPPNPNMQDARNSRVTINSFQKLEDFCSDVLGAPLLSIVEDADRFSLL